MKAPASKEIPPYPLSDEILLLPLMFTGEARGSEPGFGSVSRLDVLRLLFDGFDNSFLPAPDRDVLLSLADLETFLVINAQDLRYRVREA